ncbi:MAG: HAMP domain-containing protein [Alphaproteobacteria bacterium]|nr:HAMP domain-containing protein [Alphaproteobacteria bacterium]
MSLKMRISSRLYYGFGAVVSMVLVLGAVGFFTMNSTIGRFSEYQDTLDSYRLVSAIQEDVTEARLEAFGWRATGRPERASEVVANLDEVVRDSATLSRTDPALAAQMSEMAQAYAVSFQQAVEHQMRREQAFSDYRTAADQLLTASASDLQTQGLAGRAVFAAERFLLDNQAEDIAEARSLLSQLVNLGGPAAMPGNAASAALADLQSAIQARNLVFTGTLDDIGPMMLEASEAKADELSARALELQGVSVSALVNAQTIIIALSIIGAILSGVAAWFIASSIVRPLKRITNSTQTLVDENYDQVVQDQERFDEVGELARALEGFRCQLGEAAGMREAQAAEQQAKLERSEAIAQLVQTFDDEATVQFDGVGDYAKDLRVAAQHMSNSLDSSKEQVASVAASSEESSANVQTVASSAEELNASIGEIQRVSERVTELVSGAANRADGAKSDLQQMEAAVKEMVGAIGLINDVAEQTNLLALNATIEAARAGEAGKGFAVVASEVKSLANQAQALNEEIARKVNDVQTRSGAVTGATTEVLGALEDIRTQAAAAASVVTQQGAAVTEIAGAAHEAALGTREAASSVNSIRVTAEETSDEAQSVAQVGENLETRIVELRSLCREFLKEVSAA